jgi:hypothetical protein
MPETVLQYLGFDTLYSCAVYTFIKMNMILNRYNVKIERTGAQQALDSIAAVSGLGCVEVLSTFLMKL